MFLLVRVSFLLLLLAATAVHAQNSPLPSDCGVLTKSDPHSVAPLHEIVNKIENETRFGRTLCAEIVALDQALVYNRFGSFNPFGMMYALRRDVVPVTDAPQKLDADACDGDLGTDYHTAELKPGMVRLRDCKRPRPITLRANAEDILHIRLINMLRDDAPGFSESFCKEEGSDTGGPLGGMFHFLRQWVSEGDTSQVKHGEVACELNVTGSPGSEVDGNWTRTRGANLAIQGLTAFDVSEDGQRLIEPHGACTGLAAIDPGGSVDCYYQIEREGPFFLASTGAPSGGQGDGGSLTHGLFGAVVAEPTGSNWYRSQVSKGAFNAAWTDAGVSGGVARHAREKGQISALDRYDLEVPDPISNTQMPVLKMIRNHESAPSVFEIVHSDLNAIVQRDTPVADGGPLAFREFSVFFHDELKTFYARNFEELGDFGGGQLAGVRDGFAINYGASGMGDMLLANRKGIGPSANCQECLYEEFFLTSWGNGDPALLEQYSDDPSNVHHSYLNDQVVFRNFHAGPKETHVFHLHAHQWFAGNDKGRGAYLDSQTVAPQQGFTYNIYGGGLEVYHKGGAGEKGWYETLGSGNRNRTPGDSIFHCHLYPHFAQGMWELWRVHDVLEDGSRKLPDGQWEPALSLAEMNAATRGKKRPGSVDPKTGRWIVPGSGLTAKNIGTPIPAIVPLPGSPWPVLPSYTDGDASLTESEEAVELQADLVSEIESFPGYPFYIGGKPGHRPPQAPMDIARELDGSDNVTAEYLDGGLPRHVVGDGTERALPFKLPAAVATDLAVDPATTNLAGALTDSSLKDREALQSQVIASALALGDLTMKLKKTQIELLDYDGTPIERTGMGFHHDGKINGSALNVLQADGTSAPFDPTGGGYTSLGSMLGVSDLFTVNGAPPKPGSPFADPCGVPTAFGQVERVNESLYQFDDGSNRFDVLTVAAGQPLTLTSTVTATDAEVSNWVEYRRTDLHPMRGPRLYYIDAGVAKPINLPSIFDAATMADVIAMKENDPFLKGLGDTQFTADPAVVGYRRYEASAIQVDMITNRAGWHDPQARINVLTKNSSGYKTGDGQISPKITASEEPFFFRALSGECIEFRHTNELPKELELDDFQVRTPTDTIGQHIHLVKFDVTASDGSSNGFNYEDGTFAPGEIAVRICTAKNDSTSASSITTSRGAGDLMIREFPGMCEQDSGGKWKVSESFDHKIWRFDIHDEQAMTPNRWLFQTTAQRWFADPILSATRAPDDNNGTPGIGDVDRTLRTVFSHDHFGPSSIQQHGFYTALLIEPQFSETCESDASACTLPRVDRELIVADDIDIGPRKVIVDHLPTDTTEVARYREFALSIADFALLYDPRNSHTIDDVENTISGADSSVPMKGIMTLACEAFYGREASGSGSTSSSTSAANQNMLENCGSGLSFNSSTWQAEGGNVPPAWLASARPGDDASHSSGMEPQLFSDLLVERADGSEVPADEFLKDYLIDFRAKAAGFEPDDPDARLASPVSPPARPESISVDHHDPYLVNYRGEPYPLRIGTDSSNSSDCQLKDEAGEWEALLATGVTEECEISKQRDGEKGDFANALLSKPHGEPATPILQTHDSDPLQVRLVQGAQEVQHTFVLEGYNWPRNVDQTFPSDTQHSDDVIPNETLVRACSQVPGSNSSVRMAKAGRPDQYNQWALSGSASFSDPDDVEFWQDMDHQLANCFNTDGRVAAQEIGISEHFEFEFGLFHDSNFVSLDHDISSRLSQFVVDGKLQFDKMTVDDLLQFLNERRNDFFKRTRALDTPYHFGSQDAVWNGAWGLVRVEPQNSLFYAHQRVIATFDFYIQQLQQLGEGADVVERLKEQLKIDVDLDREILSLLIDPLNLIVSRLPELTLDKQLLLNPRSPTTDGDSIGDGQPLVPLERFDALTSIVSGILENNSEQDGQRSPDARRKLLEDIINNKGQVLDSLRATSEEEQIELLNRDYSRRNLKIPAYKQVADCPANAPNVYTAIVAIESETVFGTPTNYSDDLHDTNGLFFALVDPRRLLKPKNPASVSDTDIEKRKNWKNIKLSTVVAEVQRGYTKPEPLVLNVKAGDCVFVVMLNALKSQDGKNPGLIDDVGDAEMPRITSLNVERDWDDVLADEDVPHEHHTNADRTKDAVPSARLAVSFPLPVVTSQSGYSRPYGHNPMWSLAGIPHSSPDPDLSIDDKNPPFDDTRHAQIEQFRFYAGLAFADRQKLSNLPVLAGLSPEGVEILSSVNLPQTVSELPGLGEGTLGTLLKSLGETQNAAATISEANLKLLGSIAKDIEPIATLNFDDKLVVSADEQRLIAELLWSRSPSLTDDKVLAERISVLLPQGGDIVPLGSLLEGASNSDELKKDLADPLEQLRKFDSIALELLHSGINPQVITQRLVPEFKPYAFGALPLKSFGDFIGHPAHGLIAAISVVPQNATDIRSRAPRIPFDKCENPQIIPNSFSFEKDRPYLRLNDLGLTISEQLRNSLKGRIKTRCDTFVIVPEKNDFPVWNAEFEVPDGRNSRTIRQFTLFWQDGLNLRDNNTMDENLLSSVNSKIVEDCVICDDSYDWGDKGVSYVSEPFNVRLRDTMGTVESHFNLNKQDFGTQFFPLKPGELPASTEARMPVLRVEQGEEIVVHVVHPGGRARQRAFATIGQDYDDLFPGFGFPRAALLAPGKAITASMLKKSEAGCYLWFDGPLHLRSGGVWGLLDVVPEGEMGKNVTSCARP